MKLILISLATFVSGTTAVLTASYIVFLVVNDVSSMVKGLPETGWGIFFAFLITPILIVSAILCRVFWKRYKTLDPAYQKLSK